MASDKPLFIRLSLPNGLEESLEGLAKEVLRSQPKNIYQFAADHFESLLRKRNEGNTIIILTLNFTDRSVFCGKYNLSPTKKLRQQILSTQIHKFSYFSLAHSLGVQQVKKRKTVRFK